MQRDVDAHAKLLAQIGPNNGHIVNWRRSTDVHTRLCDREHLLAARNDEPWGDKRLGQLGLT